jgi:TonB family protein
MLGLAIALSTFGLGVVATTAWIAFQTPNVPAPAQPTVRTYVKYNYEWHDYYVKYNYEWHDYGVDPATCVAPRSSIMARVDSLKINGGVLNRRGLPGESPAPTYPPIARAAQVSGSVIVEVLVDECGNVISARPSSGHPLLQQAAVQAAYKWHFPPGLLGGEPAMVRGTLTFDFLLQ